MEADEVLVVTTPQDTIVQRHLLLTGETPEEFHQVADLLGREVVGRHVSLDLLDQGQGPVRGQPLHLRLVRLPAVQDVLGREDGLVGFDEVVEGDGSLDTDEARPHRVEDGRRIAATLLEVDAGVLQAPVVTVPGPLGGGNLARLDLLRGAEVFRVVPDEVHDDRGHTRGTCPVQPLLRRRLQVRDPEPVQERRVHLVDGVLRAVVDCGQDPGVGVELHRLAIRTIAKLTVKDNLEHTVEYTDETAVELVQEQDLGLLAGRHVPGREGEGGDTSRLNALEVRVTDNVTLLHRRGADVDHLEVQLGGQALDDLALTDTVGTANQDRHLGREGLDNVDHRVGFHCRAPLLLLTYLI